MGSIFEGDVFNWFTDNGQDLDIFSITQPPRGTGYDNVKDEMLADIKGKTRAFSFKEFWGSNEERRALIALTPQGAIAVTTPAYYTEFESIESEWKHPMSIEVLKEELHADPYILLCLANKHRIHGDYVTIVTPGKEARGQESGYTIRTRKAIQAIVESINTTRPKGEKIDWRSETDSTIKQPETTEETHEGPIGIPVEEFLKQMESEAFKDYDTIKNEMLENTEEKTRQFRFLEFWDATEPQKAAIIFTSKQVICAFSPDKYIDKDGAIRIWGHGQSAKILKDEKGINPMLMLGLANKSEKRGKLCDYSNNSRVLEL